MLVSPDVMRSLLILGLFGMALLAAIYLSRRSLTLQEYLVWGLLILLVPLLGPFLAILFAPGKPKRR